MLTHILSLITSTSVIPQTSTGFLIHSTVACSQSRYRHVARRHPDHAAMESLADFAAEV